MGNDNFKKAYKIWHDAIDKRYRKIKKNIFYTRYKNYMATDFIDREWKNRKKYSFAFVEMTLYLWEKRYDKN